MNRRLERSSRENISQPKRRPSLRRKIRAPRNPETQKLRNEMLSKDLENVLKQHSPQSLKELTRDVIDSTKNANSHTRKFLNPERVQRAHEGIRFLTSQNVPIHIAMGIIANGIAENGLSTDAHKHGLGIFQWIGARARQFRNMRANLPGATEFEKQLSFVLYELQTSEKNAGVALAAARTPEEAARIFMAKFERPKHLNFDVRQGLATGLRHLTHTEHISAPKQRIAQNHATENLA